MKRTHPLWSLLFGFILTAFTAYLLLDTFVITRVYSTAPEKEEQSSQTVEVVSTDTSYRDANISIEITEYRVEDTAVYLADVKVSSHEYLKTALANDSYGRNITQKTSEMAEENGAILAINGDYYGARQKGYVLRNGTLYRKKANGKQEDLVIYDDGTFAVIKENEVSAKQLEEFGAEQILSFGPALVLDGEIAVSPGDEVGKAMADNPRTAIGFVEDCHYLLVVSDGRTSQSKGLSLYELAEFMQSAGAELAYNLDGGGSSTMYFNGEIINFPTTNNNIFNERSVSDIVYIGY